MAHPLSSSQIKALLFAASVGKKLQEDLGDKISQVYRAGLTREQITLEFGDYFNGLSIGVAHKAIYFAIAGYNGRFGGTNYCGLIEGEELEILRLQHERKKGLKVLEAKVGIHAMTTDERRENSRRVLQSTPAEKRREILYLATLGRGCVPWEDDETKELFKCLNDPNYTRNGSPDNVAIAHHLNETFHHGSDVRNRLSVYRKRKKTTKE